MPNYSDLIARGKGTHGEQFTDVDLAPEFVKYYESGERIRVEFHYGETVTGTVGVTTGWKPVFLLKRRSSDVGSSDTLRSDDKITAVRYGRKYVEVPRARSLPAGD